MTNLQWEKYPVLNDGFVCLVDVMGSDAAIVQAARVSYGAGTKTVSDDKTLIRYLLRKGHTSPFEMAELKFLVRVPMDCWRQWIRHRTASVNEYSTRYSEAIDSQNIAGEWRLQAKNNKQGSDGSLNIADASELSADEAALLRHSKIVYEKRLAHGVAREQARKDLPLSTYTEAYWKIDLHNLLHFLKLRTDPHAQYEIRQYANVIGGIVEYLFPVTWDAFVDYKLESMALSLPEQRVIQRLYEYPANEEQFLAAQDPSWVGLERCRERDECREKLLQLGLYRKE